MCAVKYRGEEGRHCENMEMSRVDAFYWGNGPAKAQRSEMVCRGKELQAI